jgi:formiminoglutamate deiminase
VPVTEFAAERAWLGAAGYAEQVLVGVGADGLITSVERDVEVLPPDATRLPGLLLPGLVNAHSHAFHRALRGRTHTGAGDFWGWREQMYTVAERLDPDSYLALATAAYAEMALAGITTVGEFHYLHHAPSGARYDDANAMGRSLVEAGRRAGVRVVLLDACYLTADVDGSALAGPQLRFGDGSATAWADRVDALTDDLPHVGAAVHSVRACPPDAMRDVAAWAQARGAPLHLHLSEQRRENDACLAAYGVTPTRLAADTGVLGPRTTAVHATHLTTDDIGLFGEANAAACLCPTTERDLADGVAPVPSLLDAGSGLCLGSDSHAVVDLLEEARAVELDERLVSERRGTLSPERLLAAATAGGSRSLGTLGGAIAPGCPADLVTLRLDTVRTAGAPDGSEVLGAVVFGASAGDVSHVVVDGRLIVEDGQHLLIEDVPGLLDRSVRAAMS